MVYVPGLSLVANVLRFVDLFAGKVERMFKETKGAVVVVPIVIAMTMSRARMRAAAAPIFSGARPRLQNTWSGEGGHRRKAGRPSFAIMPTASRR